MISIKQPTSEDAPPWKGKHFLQQNLFRAAKNTACYLLNANKICPEQGQIKRGIAHERTA